MIKEFTITAFSENHIGLLNRITIIFTRRHINIESLAVGESAIKGVHKFTIVMRSTREQVEKVVKQIEKLVEVLKAFYLEEDEVIHQEIALYKVRTERLTQSNRFEAIMREYNARILDLTPKYTVIEKTGHKEDTQRLFHELDEFGVLQFTRSGQIAVTRSNYEYLTAYLREIDKLKEQEI
jgi:acetolactate synthase-1/3 small subunit